MSFEWAIWDPSCGPTLITLASFRMGLEQSFQVPFMRDGELEMPSQGDVIRHVYLWSASQLRLGYGLSRTDSVHCAVGLQGAIESLQTSACNNREKSREWNVLDDRADTAPWTFVGGGWSWWDFNARGQLSLTCLKFLSPNSCLLVPSIMAWFGAFAHVFDTRWTVSCKDFTKRTSPNWYF